MPKFTDDRLRQLLGLPADHDVAALQTALGDDGQPATGEPVLTGPTSTAPAATSTPTPVVVPTALVREPVAASEGVPTPTTPPAAGATSTEGAPATPAAVPSLPAGTVLLSEGQLAELQTQAAAGASAAAELARQRRAGIITVALSEGRLAPAEAENWQAALERDEAGTQVLLSALQVGRVPTTERGLAAPSTVDEQLTTLTDEAWSAWERQTFGLQAPAATASNS